MADTMHEVREALSSLSGAVDGAKDQLLSDSARIHRTQERTLRPIREWVYEVDQWMKQHERANSECKSFRERIRNLDGAYLDDDQQAIRLEYNIESAMDSATGDALDEVDNALEQLEAAIKEQPVMGHDDAAVMIREVAEVLCE